MILTDDLNLDFGNIKLKRKGSDGGHNGLKDIENCLKTPDYPRLRFGIGDKKSTSDKVKFVLGNFSKDEEQKICKSLKICNEIIFSYVLSFGAIKTLGISLSINAIGPCFISAAG